MRKIITSPLLYLFLIICFFYRPFLFQGKLPVPADTIIGLYHPYRDLYANTNPNGIAYKNALITDPIREQYPWRYQAINQLKRFHLPTWNSYSMSGQPLIGNFQSAAFYPLNILFIFLPFPAAWSLLIFAQTLLGALFMYIYIQNLKLNKWSAFLGSIVFIFSGFATAWLEWGTIFQTILWLPLVLLATDHLVKKITWRWMAFFLLAEVSMFFAGHLQTFFYAFILSNLYLLFRIVEANQKGERRLAAGLKRYVPFMLLALIFFILTAIQWLPTLKFIQASARSLDTLGNWQKEGWFIPWQNIMQFLIPDFFGNPVTGNYYGVWNYAEFIGYIGVFPLIFSVYAMFFNRERVSRFFTCIFVLALLFAFPTVIAKIPFLLQLPFLSTAQPTRLLVLVDFSLSILAAYGLDLYIRKKNYRILYIFFIVGIIFSGAYFIIYQNINNFQFAVIKHNSILPLILFFSSLFIIVAGIFVKGKKMTYLVLVAILLLCTIDVVRFSQKFNPFTDKKYLYPQTNSLKFLTSQPGQFRIMSLESEIFPPNFSLMYNLQDIDGYDPLYLTRYGELIIANERGQADIHPPFGFNRIITPQKYDSKIMNLLGLKYLLTFSDVQTAGFKKVFQEGETKIYENKNALQRVFFVKNLIKVGDKNSALQTLFNPSFNPKTSAVVESPYPALTEFSTGTAKIISYQSEQIQVEISAGNIGFLVLTDVYYPTWHATVYDQDMQKGEPLQIYQTDYDFRGVVVPAGKHIIVFTNTLL